MSQETNEREAIIDTLYRCIHGLDTNDKVLFESTMLQSPSAVMIGGGFTLQGWEQISSLFERVFQVVTTHFITNARVELVEKNGEDEDRVKRARLTCHALAVHVRPEEAMSKEDKSYTAGCLYEMGFVRGEEGVWRVERWVIETKWTTGDVGVLHPGA